MVWLYSVLGLSGARDNLPLFLPHRPWFKCRMLQAGLFTLCGIVLAGCISVRGAPGAPIPTPSLTPWPTLAPLMTAEPGPQEVAVQAVGPQLIDKFRVQVMPEVLSVFPLAGDTEHPVRVEVIVLSGDVDPIITINNEAGDQLASANRSGVGEPETIGQFQFPSTGYYELGIGSASGQGDVGVSIYSLDPALLEGGGVFTSMDQELHGTMRQPASYHTFRLPVERGKRFDLSAAALTEGLDLQFELYGPDGALLEARDDNIGKDPYLWNYMPSQTGTYTVVLSNFDEHVGDYVLKVSPSTAGGEAVVGTRTKIDLSAEPRRSVWFTLDGSTPDGVLVDARPATGMDLTVAMYDQYGNRLTLADLGGDGARELLSFVQFPFDGSYQVEFSTKSGGGEMEYYIRPIRQVDIELGGKTAPGGGVKKGEISGPGMVLAYTFDAQAGDLIGVDAHATGGTGLDLGFDLYSPDGYLLVTKDDDVGKDPMLDRIELTKSGRYVLLLWNYGGSTGPFELFVTSPEAPATPPGGG
jgi:hypothetical protein